MIFAAVSACKDPAKGEPDAAPSSPSASSPLLPPPTTLPLTSTTAALSASPPVSLGDAGTACRLEHGAVALPLSGPAALYARKDGGVDVVQNDKGAARLVSFGASAKDPPQAPREGAAKSSSVPCALTEKLAFCTDAKGTVHRASRDGAEQTTIGTARLGTRLAAADLAGHAVVAFVAEGATAIAQLWSDDGATTRLSDEGQGATFVDLAPRAGSGKDEVLALTLDGHMGMSPVHARTVWWAGKPALGPDVVLWVGGNAESSSGLAVATTQSPVGASRSSPSRRTRRPSACSPCGWTRRSRRASQRCGRLPERDRPGAHRGDAPGQGARRRACGPTARMRAPPVCSSWGHWLTTGASRASASFPRAGRPRTWRSPAIRAPFG